MFRGFIRGRWSTTAAAYLLPAALYYLLAAITMGWFQTVAVWPSSGVAVGTLLLFGARFWPSVALGTFLSNIHYFVDSNQWPFLPSNLLVNLGTITANTLAALIAHRLITRDRDVEPFSDFGWVLERFLPAALLCGLVSSIIGTAGHLLLDPSWGLDLVPGIVGWTISDATGVLLITPVMYFVWHGWPLRLTRRQWTETNIQLLLLLIIGVFIFGPLSGKLPTSLVSPSFLWLPLLWASIRSPPLAANLLNNATFFLVWTGTERGYGPFALTSLPTETTLEKFLGFSGGETSMQIFLGFTTAVLLLVQALVGEQKRAQEELEDLNEHLEAQVERRTRDLTTEVEERKALEGKLRHLAYTDSLTGVLNRRGFLDAADKEVSRIRRHGRPVSLMIMDIDHFKKINDTHGHLFGDAILKDCMTMARELLRNYDLVGRIGGEEFALLLPETDLTEASEIGERVRKGLEELDRLDDDGQTVRFTVSIGIAVVRPEESDFMQTMRRADHALYRAKKTGRNRVCVEEESRAPANQD